MRPLGLEQNELPPDLVALPANLLAVQLIEQVEPQLAKALGLDPARHTSAGLVTCDQDDALYTALDHCTKFAEVDVVLPALSMRAQSTPRDLTRRDPRRGRGRPPRSRARGAVGSARRPRRGNSIPYLPGREPAGVLRACDSRDGELPGAAGGAPDRRADGLSDRAAPRGRGRRRRRAQGRRGPPGEVAPAAERDQLRRRLSVGEIAALEAAAIAFVEAIRAVARSPLSALRRPERLRR